MDRGQLWVDADPTRFEQIVVNLLNNAAKYSDNGGHIRLTANREGNNVVIRVRDTGIGIPPEKLSEIFTLFNQADHSSARTQGGLGIGLTIVKSLVELHGGQVEAASDGLGTGSEFTVRLPVAECPAAADELPRESSGAPRISRILVVDDNVDTARGLEVLLNLSGHEVMVAHCGIDAIALARARTPQFILLDLGLPGMSGYDVASRLRAEPCGQQATIVAVSGYAQDEDRQRTKAAGFDHHLVKPVSFNELLTLLDPERPGAA